MRVAALLTCLLLATCGAGRDYVPRQGDIVFHTSRSAQSEQFISPAAMFASDLLETVHER